MASVVATHSAYTSVLVHVYLERETIVCTGQHPFWVPGRGWTEAGELEPGDELRNVQGDGVPVLRVENETLCYPIRVYNITVSPDQTYFIGESHILVHNKP